MKSARTRPETRQKSSRSLSINLGKSKNKKTLVDE
jgi:hypothetical protein